MTDQEIKIIVEEVTQSVIGDRQEMTEDEAKRIVWLVAEILTGNGQTE